jgi:hypothetical protein
MNNQQKVGTVPPVRVYAIINSLRGFFKKLYFRFIPANMAVFEKARGFWIAKSIGVACELNLAEIIGRREMPVDEIAKQSNTEPSALYRLMRALASEGIFEETKSGEFKNNDFSNALTEAPGNLKNMILHQVSESNLRLLSELKHSVVSGKNSAQKLFGTDIFSHLQNNSEKNEMYNKAMSETSLLSSASIVSAYSFKGIDTLADIGGGEGMLLCSVLQKNKDLKGILFDLPHVVATAGEMVKSFGLEERIQIVPGSFFETRLPEADAYLLKNILHAFDDDTCVLLLKSIAKSMIGKGKVLLVETVIKNDNKEAFGKILDLQMLIGTENGRERTEAEFRHVFEAAGFSLNNVVKTVSPFCVIEGVKK